MINPLTQKVSKRKVNCVKLKPELCNKNSQPFSLLRLVDCLFLCYLFSLFSSGNPCKERRSTKRAFSSFSLHFFRVNISHEYDIHFLGDYLLCHKRLYIRKKVYIIILLES